MRTNEAREKAAEDHSFSRFMGSKRAMGDDIEQLADLVHTDKREKPCNSVRKNELVAYLNLDPSTEKGRKKCHLLSSGPLRCYCKGARDAPCDCTCGKQSGNTKLAK